MNILNLFKRLIPRKIFLFFQPAYHFALNFIAALWYRFPANQLAIIGVTGTTGKTSSILMTAAILRSAGYRVGYTSTAMFSDGVRDWNNDKKMTMVGRFFTQKILAQMVRNGCQFALVETTSEGIRQFRHRFINYDILLFTGIYPEHIESHGSFENYKQAKGELFNHLKRFHHKYFTDKWRVAKISGKLKKLDYQRLKKTIIANLDDDQVSYFLDFWAERKIGFGFGPECHIPEELIGKKIEQLCYNLTNADSTGLDFNFTVSDSLLPLEFKEQSFRAHLNILGDYNITNAIGAIAIVLALGITPEKILLALQKIDSLPGRMENINCGQEFKVIVDYAYEPHALERLYENIALFDYNTLIHVFGSAGGGRDKSRRPILGKMVAGKADVGIITNEDPYDEDPMAIMQEIKAGASDSDNLMIIPDRKEAIRTALQKAEPGDLVLITGKGSEQFICLKNGDKMRFDDREIAKQLLKEILG